MSTPKEIAEAFNLREERQELLDRRYRLLKKKRPRDARKAEEYDAQLRRWERRMTAIDLELNRLTGVTNNWRRDITPNQ